MIQIFRVILLACLAASGAATQDGATLAITGARVWTGNPGQPWAEAVAVRGERILAVGTDQDIGRVVSASTRIIDARGRMLTPGFIDSHTHLSMPVPAFTPISIRFVRTKAKFIERIAAYAAKAPKGAWILGGEWDHLQWGGELPTRQWIDGLTPDNPVWLYHVDQEMAFANSAALRAAGISRETKETPRGGILRDAAGEPTGIVRLSAMSMVDAAAEAADSVNHDRVLDESMRRMAAHGITSVHNMTGWSQLLVFRRARASGRLHTRIYAAILPIAAWRRLVEYTSVEGSGDGWLRWTAMKGYAQNWPECSPGGRRTIPGAGTVGPSLEDFRGWVSSASMAGIHILVHDGGGIHQLLGILEGAKRDQKLADPRFRIEHVFYLTGADAARFAGAGVIGSLQPDLAFSYDDPREFQNHLPYRLLLEAGARMAFGSDQPIGSPLAGMALAVTHPIAEGQTLNIEQALRAYTCDAAYAAFEENEKGTLERGKLADLVLIDRDITRVSPQEIREARVQLTLVGGQVTYESPF